MSAALINRSLTTIRTELEFLLDSEVIDKSLFDKLVNAIPVKYQKDQGPWGVTKLGLSTESKSEPESNSLSTKSNVSPNVDKLSEDFAKMDAPSNPPPSYSINGSEASTPLATPLMEKRDEKVLGYCKALYDYEAREREDLALKKDDRLAIVEHLSNDWWKGYKKENPSQVGVFPSNYVSSIGEDDFKNSRGPASVPSISIQPDYNPNNYGNAPQPIPQQNSGYQQQGYNQNQPIYQMQGQQGYSNPNFQVQNQSNPSLPFSPNYYQQVDQQQQQQQQQQNNNHPHLRKYGSQLGNSIVTGAGFTIGSDIVNSILR